MSHPGELEGLKAAPAPHHHEEEGESFRRDRLLSSLNLMAGTGLLLALPFALRAGAVFFLPITTALVIAIVLVPPLEWLERRRVPPALAAFLCVSGFLLVANAALAAIVVPASNWLTLVPERLGQLRQKLAPLLDAYSALQRFVDQFSTLLDERRAVRAPQAVTIETPNSLVDLLATSAPAALVQMLFGLLLIYFFLSTYSRMRRRSNQEHEHAHRSLRMARTVRTVVNSTAAYIGTISVINLTVGAVVALVMAMIGMPSPVMWGGIAALLNFVPYVGPIATTGVLAFGGLLTFDDLSGALLPAGAFVAIHALEANLVTPLIVGRRLTINPLFILIALSYWGWVWGTIGALLSVPLLIMMKVLLDSAGRPDIAGFLFEDRTLADRHEEDVSGPLDTA